MTVYILTWNLNKERSGYDAAREHLLSKIKTYENYKEPGLDSTHFINTEQNVQQIFANLSDKMDKNDRLIICRMRPLEYYGLLQKPAWDWIASRA